MIAETQVYNYFDPAEEKSNVAFAPGNYYGHITALKEPREVTVRKKYKAKVYNFVFTVANETANHTYNKEGIDGNPEEVSGREYVGRDIRSAGIFQFLAPQVGDTFKANSGGNRKFVEFCETAGIVCPEVEIEVDGEKRTVKTIPDCITDIDVVGKPVIATVGFGKPWKGDDGVERKSIEVKSILEWKGGKEKETDLPF